MAYSVLHEQQGHKQSYETKAAASTSHFFFFVQLCILIYLRGNVFCYRAVGTQGPTVSLIHVVMILAARTGLTCFCFSRKLTVPTEVTLILETLHSEASGVCLCSFLE